jgi:hypothetical protein
MPFKVGASEARVGSRGANRRGRRCLHSADMMSDPIVRVARRVVMDGEVRGAEVKVEVGELGPR